MPADRARYRPARPARATFIAPDREMTPVPELTVFEPADDWCETGLLDRNGAPLVRRVGVGPIGFLAEMDE